MMVLFVTACIALGILVAASLLIRRFENMPIKRKKKLFTKTINKVYTWFEDHGLMLLDWTA